MATLILPNQGKSTSPKKLYNTTGATNNILRCRIHVTFIDKEGERHEFEVAKGDNLLDIAQANDIDMEGMVSLDFAC